MNEAIKLAIEKGGYGLVWDEQFEQAFFTDGNGGYFVNDEKIILDPEFWKSLGKALGLKEYPEDYDCDCGICNFCNGQTSKKMNRIAHQYFDLVLTGGDVEAFWQELISTK